MLVQIWLGLATHALVARPAARADVATRLAVIAPRRTRPPLAQDSFDVSAQQFDLLSLRSYRRETILQYDATNQSEPLRIALTFFGVLFSISIPTLASELQLGTDGATTSVAAVVGTAISGALFLRNRAARTARMEQIDREYAMGDLRVVYRGVRTLTLRDLRGKMRVVAIGGSRVDATLEEARVYRRRLACANCVVVPVRDAVAPVGGAESRWLYAPAEPDEWRAYFDGLLAARRLSEDGEGAWLALTTRGRSVGSGLGAPRWDELLGTAFAPAGDGFGELAEVRTDIANAAAEAAAAAAEGGSSAARGVGGAGLASAAADAASLLEAQSRFYEALTRGNAEALSALWSASAGEDAAVTRAIGEGAQIEPWAPGSQAFPPAGLRATDCDALVQGDAGWTTAIERPAEGGTLLATQRWRREQRADDGDPARTDQWRLAEHRYIPWSANALEKAIVLLRCDRRGCVLLSRRRAA